MKNLIIVGGGGMGRSVYCIAQNSIGYDETFQIKGFLDDNIHSMDGFENYPPVLGTIDEYEIQEEDIFICSIGSVKTKKTICDKLSCRGAKFHTLIAKTAIVRQNAKIGKGSIIADYVSVGADCTIGSHCLIQTYSIVAHDCMLGDYVRIDTHSVGVGGVIVRDCATVHTGAVVSHNVVIGENSVVAACSFVIRKVKSDSTVYGNPAKYLQ